jgi:hypothetical protein
VTRRFALLGLACAMLATAAGAHTRSTSYSSWSLSPEGATVQARVSLLDLSRLAFDPELDAGSGGRAARYIAERLSLERGGLPCPVAELPVALSAAEGWLRFRWQVACEASGPARLQSRLLLDVAPSHLHFARIEGEASGVLERLLTEAEASWELPAEGAAVEANAQGTDLAGYVELGVEHILTGWDHLAFLVALLLLARSLGEVAGLVTAFTVAHSVTLGLAVLGVVRPEAAAVEALIGFSIALVAAENGWLLAGRGRGVPVAVTGLLLLLAFCSVLGVGVISALTLGGLALFSACHFALLDRAHRPARLRAAVAFAFGLVHGFGFAGVLAEMALPTGRLVPALFGFNLGVELGQLGIVALIWPLLMLLARMGEGGAHRAVSEWGSATVCGLGTYWFFLRALG